MKKITLKKRIKKLSKDELLVHKSWFIRLLELADKYEENPNYLTRAFLLGYISSARFIIKNLDNK